MTIDNWDPSVVALVRRFIEEEVLFNKVLGIQVISLNAGFARLEIPYRRELIGDPLRPALHGGVISALIDTAGGAAAFTLITPPDRISTIDLRVDYLRPAVLDTLVCEATITRMGNRVASVDMKVFHPNTPAELIATGKGVYNIKRTRQHDS